MVFLHKLSFYTKKGKFIYQLYSKPPSNSIGQARFPLWMPVYSGFLHILSGWTNRPPTTII
ncbi:hypothetical protein HMPREF0262_00959 [Clostridium sp. ATCC 29733]|nr:hypothetical protein HMPREF0262_00959 [Clostridium sp. ATCC 29733]